MAGVAALGHLTPYGFDGIGGGHPAKDTPRLRIRPMTLARTVHIPVTPHRRRTCRRRWTWRLPSREEGGAGMRARCENASYSQGRPVCRDSDGAGASQCCRLLLPSRLGFYVSPLSSSVAAQGPPFPNQCNLTLRVSTASHLSKLIPSCYSKMSLMVFDSLGLRK